MFTFCEFMFVVPRGMLLLLVLAEIEWWLEAGAQEVSLALLIPKLLGPALLGSPAFRPWFTDDIPPRVPPPPLPAEPPRAEE